MEGKGTAMDFDFGEQLMLKVGNDGDSSLYQDRVLSRTSSESDPTNIQPNEENEPFLSTNGSIHSPSASEIIVFVMDAIKQKNNLLVECPPGLERRMSILQGALQYYKWRKGLNRENLPTSGLQAPKPSRIYVGVHNFSELERVFTEIKDRFETSDHLRNIKISVLGPRTKLCVNEAARQEGVSTEGECSRLLQNYHWNIQRGMLDEREARERCRYYPNPFIEDQLFSFTEDHVMFEGGLLVRDIEDFLTYDRDDVYRCPFYDSRILHADADLVITPAEYLISPVLRNENGIELQNAIVIFDDGHNIENRCLEEGSITITSMDIRKAALILQRIVSDCAALSQQNRNGVAPRVIQRFASLVEPLRELSDYVFSCAREDLRPEKEEILDRLSELNLTSSTELCEALSDLPTQPGITIPNHDILSKLKQLITVICIAQNNPGDYSIKVIEESQGIVAMVPSLFLLCSNAAVLLGHVEKQALSLILGGDCLAPITCLKESLSVNFHETLQITHSPSDINFARERYFLGYCSSGPSEKEFILNYDLRGKVEIRLEVCRAILELCKVIPGGVVVLVHSIRYARMLWSTLQGPTNEKSEEPILTQINSLKHVINLINAQPQKEEDEVNRYKHLFRQTRNGTKNGAVLFALARSPLWGNCYLKGEEIRGIIHVSVPFGSAHREYRLGARHDYLANEAALHNTDPEETYLDWYRSEAFRVLNQSFARCTQSNSDWGVVVVLDSWMHARRHEFRNKFLPAWVSNLQLLKQYKFNTLIEMTQKFVVNHIQAEKKQ